MKKHKKLFSLFLILILIITAMCNFEIIANAASTIINISSSHLKNVFDVPNFAHGNANSTNIGGISVGTANNRLFVVKSCSTGTYAEEKAILYYYNNINNVSFANGTKEPKKIEFVDGLLGHANAMAIDNKYIYVTKWQKKSGGEKCEIIQISRRAISLLSSGSTVSLTNKTVTDTDGSTLPIYTIYEPEYTNGNAYTRSIAAITRYTYNSTTEVTKFIIQYQYSSNDATLKFTIATLANGKFTVSTDVDDIFTVLNPYTDVTMQDIFYDSKYGLLIPLWKGGVNNSILCVDIRDIKTQNKTESPTFEPYKILNFSKSSDHNGTLSKYEIESLAFVKKDADLNDISYRLVFSCNKADSSSSGCDSIEEIDPLSTYLTPLS